MAQMMRRGLRRESTNKERVMEAAECLDHLISECIDSEKRNSNAANHVEREELVRYFTDQSALRQRMIAELTALRTRLYGPAKETGSISALIDRLTLDFDTTMSMGDTGVVQWCRGEAEKLEEEYRKALALDGLPPAVVPVLERQMQQVRSTVETLQKVLEPYGGHAKY
jgi:uncharacterized protein (TIGR02284 family)